MCTRILETSEQGLIALNVKNKKKFSGKCDSTKYDKVLTSLGFSRRCWTIVRRNTSWDIWIPLMRSSCFESAKNMQFPSPWLSEIAKPFSNEVLCKPCHRSVLLDSMRASRRICWSARKMGSPVNGRRKLLKKRMRLFHVSLIGHDELVCTKNSRRYKFAVLSKEQDNPILQQK